MKVGLSTSLLPDAALMWLMPYVESRSPVLDDYTEFVAQFRSRFDDPDRCKNSSKALKQLRQSQFASFTEYELQFR